MSLRTQHRAFDSLLELQDTSANITATDLGFITGEDPRIVDLYQGADSGTLGEGAEFKGELVLDVASIDQTAGNELYTVILEGCNTANFSSGDIVQLAMIQLGDEDTMLGNANLDLSTGRYIVPFTTEKNGTTYRYVRIAFVLGGTTPILNLAARLQQMG